MKKSYGFLDTLEVKVKYDNDVIALVDHFGELLEMVAPEHCNDGSARKVALRTLRRFWEMTPNPVIRQGILDIAKRHGFLTARGTLARR